MYKIFMYSVFIIYCFTLTMNSQPDIRSLELVWTKEYGFYKQEEVYKMLSSRSGDYLVLGSTNSKGKGGRDMWLMKVDDKGNKLWEKVYGDKGEDVLCDMEKTDDGGLLLVGYTKSKSGKNQDVWLVKIDEENAVEWEKKLGNSKPEMANVLVKTKDNGFLIVGIKAKSVRKRKKDGTGFVYKMMHYVWLIKVDRDGNELWQHEIESDNMASIRDVVASKDGYFIVANKKFGKNIYEDAWLLKTDLYGDVIWEKKYGGPKADMIHAITQMKDGSIILAGSTTPSKSIVNTDAWLLKLTADGESIWSRNFGQGGTDVFQSLIINEYGWLTLVGSQNGEIWVMEVDKYGTKVAEYCHPRFKRKGMELGMSILQTFSSNYIVAGYGIMPEQEGNKVYGDVRLLKLKRNY